MDKRQPSEPPPKTDRMGIWDGLLALLLGSLVAVMLIQVFCRYVLNSSLSWSEELAKYVFVWMTFIGGAICFRDNIHIGVEYFVSFLPDYVQTQVRQFNLILTILFSGIVAAAGVLWVFKTRGAYTPALGWPLNIVFYAAFPLGCAMTVYYGIKRLICDIKRERQKQ